MTDRRPPVTDAGIYVGVDPSLGTPIGIAAVDDRERLIFAASYSVPKWPSVKERIEDAVHWCVHEIEDRDLVPILVGIESPVFARNVASFGLQSRLVGALLVQWIASREINPTTAKKALTGRGNAKKDQMVAMSEAVTGWDPATVRRKDHREARADGIGIALATARRVPDGGRRP